MPMTFVGDLEQARIESRAQLIKNLDFERPRVWSVFELTWVHVKRFSRSLELPLPPWTLRGQNGKLKCLSGGDLFEVKSSGWRAFRDFVLGAEAWYNNRQNSSAELVRRLISRQ